MRKDVIPVEDAQGGPRSPRRFLRLLALLLAAFAGQELEGECMLGCKELIRSRAEGFLGFGREFGLSRRTKRKAVEIH